MFTDWENYSNAILISEAQSPLTASLEREDLIALVQELATRLEEYEDATS